jgi:hypothetical protein
MVYACNFQESLPSVDAILDTPVKYAIKLAVFKATSIMSIWINVNLVQNATRTTSYSRERNALVKLRWTICAFRLKSVNRENL